MDPGTKALVLLTCLPSADAGAPGSHAKKDKNPRKGIRDNFTRHISYPTLHTHSIGRLRSNRVIDLGYPFGCIRFMTRISHIYFPG